MKKIKCCEYGPWFVIYGLCRKLVCLDKLVYLWRTVEKTLAFYKICQFLHKLQKNFKFLVQAPGANLFKRIFE
jgi:hypothetical protein